VLHESHRPRLEGDFNRKGSSAFSGRIGERVAAAGHRWWMTHYRPAARALNVMTRAIRATQRSDRGWHPHG